jgi:competence protein ComEA
MRKNLLFTLLLVLSLTFVAFMNIQAQGTSPASPKATSEAKKVNINTASLDELTSLPGIGPKTAEKIVAWRQENGKFQKPEDLMAVKGIGEKKFARLKNLITV